MVAEVQGGCGEVAEDGVVDGDGADAGDGEAARTEFRDGGVRDLGEGRTWLVI